MKNLQMDHITLGVCYYPEHWDRALWAEDLDRMKALGLETVRIAEFAWNFFEPHEGEFTFSFFDDFMELALTKGMKVIFCTPTATPPAWMSEKYPEILNADADGHLFRHGMRRHASLNSEKYQFFTARIVEKLAEHYAKYPNIIMWQLDNEINCHISEYYAESDHKAFRTYLRKRFGTLDALNEAIGAAFWNQTYTDWGEVYLTRRTIQPGHTNPHMMLLQKEFVSDSVIHYFKLQADILRRYTEVPITTNGSFRSIDYHKLCREVLDFITYDNYPNFLVTSDEDPNDPQSFFDRGKSLNLTKTRSISSLFGIMEQQSGPGGWVSRYRHRSPKPGQLRLWTMQALAHGADFISYFRWRTCTYGTEIYWHGLLNYDNRDNRRTAELLETYKDIQKLQGVCGAPYKAEVALLYDYPNEWDSAEDEWCKPLHNTSYQAWFRSMQKRHIPFDAIYMDDTTAVEDLAGYKMVIYPHPAILTSDTAEKLKAYAAAGGTVIFGARSGYKNQTGICYMMPMPCFAAPLCGATVEDFTLVSHSAPNSFIDLGGRIVSAPECNDILEVSDGEIIGTYTNDYYCGKPAASVNKVENGKVYYFGAAFSEEAADAFLEIEHLAPPCGIGELFDLPAQVEIALRGEYLFLLNYYKEPVSFTCHGEYTDIISGKSFCNKMCLDRYGVVVIKL